MKHRHYSRHRITLTFIGLAVVMVGLLTFQSFTALGEASSDQAVELDVIARLNAWRLTEHVPPLKFNPDLQKLAYGQAKFLVGLQELPHGGEIHKDSAGKLPPDRAYDSKWPAYGMSARTDVGENAAVGDAKFALHYWEHSEIHKKTALNPGYREVGVAAIPFHKQYVIIAVFGGRPNYLPAFLFPEEGDIYFTNEQYKWKNGGNWLQNVTQIEIYDANGNSLLKAPANFVDKMKMPPFTTEDIEVVYRGGKTETRYKLNIKNDVIILPHHKQAAQVTLTNPNPNSAVSAPATVAAAPVAPKAPAPAAVAKAPIPTNTPRSIAALPTNTPRNVALPTNTPRAATASATDPTESPDSIIETDDPAEIMILYDDDSFVIVNDTDKPADIRDLKIRYSGKILETRRWVTTALPIDLSKFPADHCLMLEVRGKDPFLPEACTILRSALTVQTDQVFWRTGNFEVLRGDKVVATCKKEDPEDEDHCEVQWN